MDRGYPEEQIHDCCIDWPVLWVVGPWTCAAARASWRSHERWREMEKRGESGEMGNSCAGRCGKYLVDSKGGANLCTLRRLQTVLENQCDGSKFKKKFQKKFQKKFKKNPKKVKKNCKKNSKKFQKKYSKNTNQGDANPMPRRPVASHGTARHNLQWLRWNAVETKHTASLRPLVRSEAVECLLQHHVVAHTTALSSVNRRWESTWRHKPCSLGGPKVGKTGYIPPSISGDHPKRVGGNGNQTGYITLAISDLGDPPKKRSPVA